MEVTTSLPRIIFLYLGLVIPLFLSTCNEAEKTVSQRDLEATETEILQTLNNETASAFRRDYDAWATFWVHDDRVSKTYIDLAEGDCSESVGWEEISGFVSDFFRDHPEPEPVPALLDNINVAIYGTGATVHYEQLDSLRGRKRETRLMELHDGRWRIAGMHTTIYGFGTEED